MTLTDRAREEAELYRNLAKMEALEQLCDYHEKVLKSLEKCRKCWSESLSTLRCNRTLHHNGGVYHCTRASEHEPDGHLFELPDVDTRIE